MPPVTLDGLYNAHGVYGSLGDRFCDSVILPDWCRWSDTGSVVTFAALYSDQRPHISVFSNRSRGREDARGYKPKKQEVAGTMLTAEQTCYDTSISNYPQIVSRIAGGISVDRLFEVVSVDTGDHADVFALLTTGIEAAIDPSVIERIQQLQGAGV